jgi:hypothetical protein
MKFEHVLKALIEEFRSKGVDLVLSGGLALSTMGIARFTRDIDFIVYEEDKEAVHGVMAMLGYEKQDFSTDEIVSYWSPVEALGQVDFLLARRKYTRAMMRKADLKPVFSGQLEVHTVRPEDLIGLKVQAICNDPARYLIDAPDIQRLLRLHGQMLDMELICEYFRIFGKEDLLDEWLQEAGQ